ncbi:hypothetical protein O9G_001932 [Rozella allomycis CSF55]|uniref:F-box domain-containing protein n=1 Tax=Rozella allomycis (strain CSF55) TaxID=988480 RepID=A0A075ATN9_ROZAC|nr:hypothetical protein O9G_001932 [Rozella allomycis CSF55]|eukprot:EPZ31922.1 hypothetical protein O9G_001932 [Rozella allomycis CSF55]
MTSKYLISLPIEIILKIAHFLPGWDLITLAQTSSFFYNTFKSDEIWAKKMGPQKTLNDYIEARTPYFDRSKNPKGSSVQVEWDVRSTDEFSVEVIFACLPADEGRPFGGIILGAQSIPASSNSWPHFHRQMISVGPNGHLFCSATDDGLTNVIVKPNRWYHLVLSFDYDYEKVFIDGQLVRTISRPILDSEYYFYEAHDFQIGTGCISGTDLYWDSEIGAPKKPSKDHCGWYGFHGYIDKFIILGNKTDEESVILMKNNAMEYKESIVHLHEEFRFTGIPLVKTTRPLEIWL